MKLDLNHNIEKRPTFHIAFVELNFPTQPPLTKRGSYLMSPKLFSQNSLMERRKPQESTTRELAFVKAAAWAWHQHGSGSERKATSEFHATRTQRGARPSRYKLEAMRMAKEAKEEGSKIHSNKNSLLDMYEILCISRQLDRLIEAGHNELGNGNGNNFANSGNRRTNKKRMVKGFWSRHGVVVCGGSDDVVDGKTLTGRRLLAKLACTYG